MSLSDHYQRTTLPKPAPAKTVKAKKDREDAKQLAAMREEVWLREYNRGYAHTGYLGARCQRCQARVYRAMAPVGEVHHIIPRSRCTPEQRYDPANGMLVCRPCHRLLQEHKA